MAYGKKRKRSTTRNISRRNKMVQYSMARSKPYRVSTYMPSHPMPVNRGKNNSKALGPPSFSKVYTIAKDTTVNLDSAGNLMCSTGTAAFGINEIPEALVDLGRYEQYRIVKVKLSIIPLGDPSLGLGTQPINVYTYPDFNDGGVANNINTNDRVRDYPGFREKYDIFPRLGGHAAKPYVITYKPNYMSGTQVIEDNTKRWLSDSNTNQQHWGMKWGIYASPALTLSNQTVFYRYQREFTIEFRGNE